VKSILAERGRGISGHQPPGEYRYTIESVEPSHRITKALAHHRAVNETLKNKGEGGRAKVVYHCILKRFFQAGNLSACLLCRESQEEIT